MTPETAFAAHRRLVEIHPFNDGNGRTARLLMNLVLIRGGYPPVPVRPEDRPRYIAALNEAQENQRENLKDDQKAVNKAVKEQNEDNREALKDAQKMN